MSAARTDTAPLGIKIICGVGAFTAVFSLFGGLAAFGVGPVGAVAGLFVVALSLGRLVVLYGLWTLQPWGWTWSMVLYGLGFGAALLRFDLVTMVVTLVVLGYVYSKRGLYGK